MTPQRSAASDEAAGLLLNPSRDETQMSFPESRTVAPMHAEEIEGKQSRERAERLRHTHGYVDASGDVSMHVVLPPEKGMLGQQKGDHPLLWMNGSVQVTDRHRKMGGRLLAEVCAADGCPEKYEMWKRAIGFRGKVEIRNYLDLYPPTVLKLRRESAAGVTLDQVFDAAVGGLVPVTEDVKARRVADLLDGAAVGRPTPEDRKAAKA